MAHTLGTLGYLEKGPSGRGYVLGKKILERTFDFLRGSPWSNGRCPSSRTCKRKPASAST